MRTVTTRTIRLRQDSKEPTWELRLYVAGQTTKSLQAFANLKRICEEHLASRYQIEVVDLLTSPELAQGDQILALPTLVRKLPEPVRKIIGDLSNTERVLVGLDLRPSCTHQRSIISGSPSRYAQSPENSRSAKGPTSNSPLARCRQEFRRKSRVRFTGWRRKRCEMSPNTRERHP